jgi:hypothetical protein
VGVVTTIDASIVALPFDPLGNGWVRVCVRVRVCVCVFSIGDWASVLPHTSVCVVRTPAI